MEATKTLEIKQEMMKVHKEIVERRLKSKRAEYNALAEYIQSLELDINRRNGIAVYEDLDRLDYEIKRLERILRDA